MGIPIPGSLQELLASQTPRKCGLGARQDAMRVEGDLGVNVNGVLELDEMAEERGFGAKVPKQTAKQTYGECFYPYRILFKIWR